MDVLEREVPLTTFDLPHEAPIKIRQVRQFFLRQFRTIAKLAQSRAERGDYISFSTLASTHVAHSVR